MKDTEGWQIRPEVEEAVREKTGSRILDKPTFGSVELGEYMRQLDQTEGPVGRDYSDRSLHRYLCDFKRASSESISSGSVHPGGGFLLRGGDAGKP